MVRKLRRFGRDKMLSILDWSKNVIIVNYSHASKENYNSLIFLLKTRETDYRFKSHRSKQVERGNRATFYDLGNFSRRVFFLVSPRRLAIVDVQRNRGLWSKSNRAYRYDLIARHEGIDSQRGYTQRYSAKREIREKKRKLIHARKSRRASIVLHSYLLPSTTTNKDKDRRTKMNEDINKWRALRVQLFKN